MVLHRPLKSIINASLEAGKVPSLWKIAKVIPLFKGGEKNNIISYRPLPASGILKSARESSENQTLQTPYKWDIGTATVCV